MPTDSKRKKNKLKAKSQKQIVRTATPHNPDNNSSGVEVTPEIQEIEKLLLRQLSEATRKQDFEDSMWQLISFYSRTERQEIAFNYVNKLVERMDDPDRAAECYLAMGQLMEQMRDYKAAIEYYEQVALLEPTERRVAYLVNNNLGYCLNCFGRYEEAESYCRKAIAIDPERHNAYKNLGISLEGQKHIGDAAMSYISAVKANANDPRALDHLENLIDNNRGIVSEIHDIKEQLEDCRKAVKAAHDLKMKISEDENKCSA